MYSYGCIFLKAYGCASGVAYVYLSRRGYFASYFRLADRGRQVAVLCMVGWCALFVYLMWFAFG